LEKRVSVKLRLRRLGRKNRDSWRLGAVDSRLKRDGKVLEELGHYDPLMPDETKQAQFNLERVKYWLSVGALASPTVASLLKKQGITIKEKPKGSRAPKVKMNRKEAKKLAKAAANA
jgi:small subunit ribosomal protein S16